MQMWRMLVVFELEFTTKHHYFSFQSILKGAHEEKTVKTTLSFLFLGSISCCSLKDGLLPRAPFPNSG